MNLFKNPKSIILILIFLAITVGFFSMWILPELSSSDQREHDMIAQGIIHEHTYKLVNDGDLHKPGYSFFLVIIYSIFGRNITLVIILQFIMLSVISYYIFKLSREFLYLSNWLSLLAAIFVLFWPYLILYSNMLLTEILYTFFLILFIYEFLIFIKNPTSKYAIISGSLFALATLVRPDSLLFPVWIIIFLFFTTLVYRKIKFIDMVKKYSKNSLILLIVFVILITPWTIFASKKMGKFTPLASTGNEVFAISNGTFYHEWEIYHTPGYYNGMEWTFAKWLESKARNVYRFWKSGATGVNVDKLTKLYPATKYVLILYRLVYYIILTLFFLSIFFINKNKYIFALWIFILYTWAFHVLLFVYPRLTLPIIPLVIALAFYSVSEIKNKYFINEKIQTQ